MEQMLIYGTPHEIMRIQEAYRQMSPEMRSVYSKLSIKDRTAELAWNLVKAASRASEISTTDLKPTVPFYKWHNYEAGKKRIPACSPSEYDASIEALVERCKV